MDRRVGLWVDQPGVELLAVFLLIAALVPVGGVYAQNGPLDLIVVVDNSNSMVDEVIEVQGVLIHLFNSLLTWDPHLIVISADNSSIHVQGICVPAPLGSGSCPDDENLPIYRHVVQTVASDNALEMLLQVQDQYLSFLREGSRRAILVVSDSDSALPAVDFIQQLFALELEFTGVQIHAVASPIPPPIWPWLPCGMTVQEEGAVYRALTTSRAGVFRDICLQETDQAWLIDMVPLIVEMTEALVFIDGFEAGNTNVWRVTAL